MAFRNYKVDDPDLPPIRYQTLGNGTMRFYVSWRWGVIRSFDVIGGPYDDFPGTKTHFGVCVRAERSASVQRDLHVPIVDFDVPRDILLMDHVLKAIIHQGLNGDGRPIYIGCMGGYGRTGLFLAVLAKACGATNPVGDVRDQYCRHAVETVPQATFVNDYDVEPLVHYAKAEARRAYFRSWFPWA